VSGIDDWLDSLPKAVPEVKEPEVPEGDKLKEFFFPKPNLSPYELELKSQGKCPKCAMPGRISMSAFVCDIHGEY
jgi:hypothetical protein